MNRKKKKETNRTEQKEDIVLSELDREITEYIGKIRFRKKLLGIDEAELWTVLLNIQKYYEEKDHLREAEQKLKEEALCRERDSLREENEKLRRLVLLMKKAAGGEP